LPLFLNLSLLLLLTASRKSFYIHGFFTFCIILDLFSKINRAPADVTIISHFTEKPSVWRLVMVNFYPEFFTAGLCFIAQRLRCADKQMPFRAGSADRFPDNVVDSTL